MSTIRNIIGVILMLFTASCSTISADDHLKSKVLVDQPRVFKFPLLDTIYKDVPIIDQRRDNLLDRLAAIDKRITPDDKDLARILANTEYAIYIAFHVAIAEGDQEAADYYKEKLFNIYKALKSILSRYAILSGGSKYEF